MHGTTVNTETEPGPSIIVATNRSTFDTGTTTARAGAGIFYQEGNPKNRCQNLLPRRKPQEQVTTTPSNTLTAIKTAIGENHEIPNLYIDSDSKYAVHALTWNLTQHEDHGYIGMANTKILQATVATLRSKKGRTMLK
jgi:ribonuclease HI